LLVLLHFSALNRAMVYSLPKVCRPLEIPEVP